MAAETARSGYAPVNGVNLYYEIHGEGEPLILLHGGLGTIDMLFGDLLPRLAEYRQVIAVELQGHGHTADVDRPFSYELMSDDISALVRHFGAERMEIAGFSLGGGVALQTAIRHPEVVKRLVLISTPFKREGWYPEVLAGMSALSAEAAQMMLQTPMYQAYAAVAPNPESWKALVAKTGELLRQDYDWSAGVATVMAPVLIVVGDSDSVRPAHAFEMFTLLGGGQFDGAMTGLPRARLAVLPGTTHMDILSKTDLLVPTIASFLSDTNVEAR